MLSRSFLRLYQSLYDKNYVPQLLLPIAYREVPSSNFWLILLPLASSRIIQTIGGLEYRKEETINEHKVTFDGAFLSGTLTTCLVAFAMTSGAGGAAGGVCAFGGGAGGGAGLAAGTGGVCCLMRCSGTLQNNAHISSLGSDGQVEVRLASLSFLTNFFFNQNWNRGEAYLCFWNRFRIQATSFITGRLSGIADQHAAIITRISSGRSSEIGGRKVGSDNWNISQCMNTWINVTRTPHAIAHVIALNIAVNSHAYFIRCTAMLAFIQFVIFL